MKNSIVGWSALALAIGSWVFAYLDRSPKIGYVETTVLMSGFSGAEQAKKQFEEAQKEWDKNLKILDDSLLAGMETMKRDYDKAGKPAKDSLRAMFEKRNDDYQRYVQAVKKMSQEKENELMAPVISKINGFLDQWGKENGYDLVLGTMQGGNILQASSKWNLTQRILADLNAQYRDLPAAAPAPAPAPKQDSALSLNAGKKP